MHVEITFSPRATSRLKRNDNSWSFNGDGRRPQSACRSEPKTPVSTKNVDVDFRQQSSNRLVESSHPAKPRRIHRHHSLRLRWHFVCLTNRQPEFKRSCNQRSFCYRDSRSNLDIRSGTDKVTFTPTRASKQKLPFSPLCSGCHINPAVTLGAFCSGLTAPGVAVAYIASQLTGGVVGAALTRVSLNNSEINLLIFRIGGC